MRNGEIEVSGSNQIEISLKERPRHVKVHFRDDNVSVPCNPITFDELEWCVREVEKFEFFGHRRVHYFLDISWSVSETRAIIWHVQY